MGVLSNLFYFFLARAATRIMELSEATSSDETWQMLLFYGLKLIAYDLESVFETLQSYSLIQWKPDQKINPHPENQSQPNIFIIFLRNHNTSK